MNYNKKEILKLKSLEELSQYEDELYKEVRNDYYNTILKDKDIEKHLEKILDTDRDGIEYKLMINGKFELLPDIDLDYENDYNYSELDENSSLSKLISVLWDSAMKDDKNDK